MTVEIVDAFAGPGGWEEGLRKLGQRALGIEWDASACETARAAGHERLQADVAALDPKDFPCKGFIASAPCTPWSSAGKGGGQRDRAHVYACAREVAAGGDTRAKHAAACEDEHSMLIVEPLRWIRDIRPEWIALEQVPPVLEFWRWMAPVLEEWGYYVWTGILEAERYGVPQTRERAILMASRDPVSPPAPTHQRFVKGVPAQEEHTFEGTILPWVSMAEALGWEGKVGFPRQADDAEATEDGYRARDFRDAGEPAFNLTEKARSWVREPPSHYGGRLQRDGRTGKLAPRRRVDEPAPTIAGESRADEWAVVDTGNTRGQGVPLTSGRERAMDEPARPLTSRADQLFFRNNSNEKAGRRRVDEPAPTTFYGHACNEVGWVADPEERVNRTGVRVTLEEAAILQGFRGDYPFTGSRTKQFEQVGNAVPPPLAAAILRELV